MARIRHLLESLESRLLLSQTPLPITVAFGNTTLSSETAPGQTAPSFSNGTDFRFASTTAPGAIGAITRSFTITNTSDSDLNFGNVTLSGANAGDFSIVATLPGTLAAGSPATLTIAFNPTATGTRVATITIPGTGPGDQPFIFDVDGTGIATQNLPDGLEIGTIQAGNGNATAANGDVLQMSYTGYLLNGSLFDATALHNGTPLTFRLDDAPLHPYVFNDQNFDSSFDFTVIDGWEEGLQGMKVGESRVLIIPSALGYGHTGSPPAIPADAPLVFETDLNQVFYSPEIAVLGANNNRIAPGSSTPNGTDGTEFGALPQGETSITHNFTLSDYSSADDANGTPLDGLTFAGASGFSITGQNASDFSVSQVAVQQGVYAITFSPSGLGLRTATVHVHSNDQWNPDYTFAIEGTNTRAVAISANSLSIPNGEIGTSTDNYTDFRYQSLSFSDAVTRTYTVTNTGNSTLTLGNITIAGANPGDFVVSSPPAITTLAPNQSTTFTVEFTPTVAGNRAAVVTVNTDAPGSPYVFSVSGVGVATTLMAGNGRYATMVAGSGNVTATNGDLLQITYQGAPLTGGLFSGSASFRLDNAAGFPYISNDNSAASIKNTYDFAQIAGWENGLQGIKIGETRILFLPASQTAGATANGSMVPSEPLLYLVTCTGIAYSPQIGVSGNGVTINGGSTTPTSANGTDFGTLTGSQRSTSQTFDVFNNSLADDANGNPVQNLVFGGTPAITFTGADAGDFSVTAVAGQPGFYSITFQPLGAGLRTATVHFASNDPEVPDYAFAIQGSNNAIPDLHLDLGTTHFPLATISTNTNAVLSVPITITNLGAGSAIASPATDVEIYAQNTKTNAMTLLATYAGQAVSLAPMGSVSYNLNAPIPLTLPTGSYTLVAMVNQSGAVPDFQAGDDSMNTVQAFSVLAEYNNVTGHVLSSTLPKSLLAKTPLAGAVTLTLNNAGTLTLSKNQQASVALLARNTVTGAQTLLTTLPVQSLANMKPGGSLKVTAAIKFPAGLVAGTYTVLERITPTPKLAESSTADDLVNSAFTFTVNPPTYDLTGTLNSSTLKSSAKGVSGNLNLTLRSLGNVNLSAAQKVQLQIIAHPASAVNAASDIVLGTTTVSVANLAPQKSLTFTVGVNYTKVLHGGAYHIEVRLVPTPHLAETNTVNDLLTQKVLTLVSANK